MLISRNWSDRKRRQYNPADTYCNTINYLAIKTDRLADSWIHREAPINRQSRGHAQSTIQSASRILVLTGAGISAESGVPTFRGPGGLWKSFRAEDLAIPEAFERDPRLCWEWYAWRRNLVAACFPNPAHSALAAWLLQTPGARLVTQNVDGLHEVAARETAGDRDPGPAMPICLHGSIFRTRCTTCDTSIEYRHAVDSSTVDALPHCDGCMGLLRPDVVWFGEMLPRRELRLATEAATVAEVCLVIGTQGSVYPAAGLVHQARAAGARIIVVDPARTELDPIADIRLHGSASEVVPSLLGLAE